MVENENAPQAALDPRQHDVVAPQGTPQELRDGRRALAGLPRYDRKKPWRTFVNEFISWLEMNDIYACGDDFIKKALVGAMIGQAQDMMVLHRSGTPTFNNSATWRRYAQAIERIFAPPSESQLAKQEFKNYKQRATEDVSSYLSNKRALHNVAYQDGAGNFDNLLDEVINGLCNKEVKLQLRRANPTNEEQMETVLVQIVANERQAYEAGYSRCETKDGLYHTTMIGRRPETQDEPMEVSAMTSKIQSMEEEINAFKQGKPFDKSNITCHKCQKKGHFAKECRGGKANWTKPTGSRPSQGKFQFECHHCGKKGHKKDQCFKWKKEQQGSKKGKIRELEEKSTTEEKPAEYSRFLALAGETEEN
jgi:hypothetical protein